MLSSRATIFPKDQNGPSVFHIPEKKSSPSPGRLSGDRRLYSDEMSIRHNNGKILLTGTEKRINEFFVI